MPTKHFLLLLLASALAFSTNILPAAGKTYNTQVYAFGVGTCLGDTVTYISALQPLDSAQIDRKTGFLKERESYSAEMEYSLRQRLGKHFTCATFYATNKKDLEKQYLRIKKQLGKDKRMRIEELPNADFQFSKPVATGK